MLCGFTLVNLFKDLNETSGCNSRREHAYWTAHQTQFLPIIQVSAKGPVIGLRRFMDMGYSAFAKRGFHMSNICHIWSTVAANTKSEVWARQKEWIGKTFSF